MLAHPKPEPRRRVQARNKRVAAKIVRDVRQACIVRDGYCRYALDMLLVPFGGKVFLCISECAGPGEWAHLNEFARYKTRGKPPAARHHTHGTAMICKRHHEMLHKKALKLTFESERGADGPIAWERIER